MSKPFSKLNFSLPFSMDTAVPVDYNSFFTSYNEASAAASTAASAGSNESIYYIGQQLYVVDDVEKTVKTYLISHDKTLTDIGKNYTFTAGLSSDGQNVGIDTTNIVSPSSTNEYLKFADAKGTYEFIASNYVPLSGASMTGSLGVKSQIEIVADNLQTVITPRTIYLKTTDGVTEGTIKIPSDSGTLALTSAYLSGYGIEDAYTKSETMSSIDGNGRYVFSDVTTSIETGTIPLIPYCSETLSADGRDLTFAFLEKSTFDISHQYYSGESVWYDGLPYKCLENHIGTWDSSKFKRVYRELLVDIDCTGIEDSFNVTWPFEIDVFGGSTSADISTVSGEHNVYRIAEYRDGYFSIDKIGGNGTSEKIRELSLLIAKNAENNASNTLQNVTNYNLIMELYRERQ